MPGGNFPLTLVISALDKTTQPLQQMTARMKSAASTFANVGKTLSVGVTAPLAAFAGLSFAAFARFEESMGNVSTLVDTNTESMADMEAGVFRVMRAVKAKPLSELTEALYEARSAGVSAADQFKVLENSGKLAVVGLGSTKEALDLVTSSVNAFRLQGEEADRVYNLIFQATNTGKTTISGLAQGFGGVAGTVAAAGVKLDEYLASVAALTTTGLPAAEAHTQLKAVIAGLTGQTKEAAAIFQRLKVKGIKELITESGGLVPALERIRGVVKDNDTVLLNAVGGAEAFNAVLGLTGNQADAFKSTLATMRSGVDGLSVAFDKQTRTSAASMQSLKNNIEAASISVGKILAPEVEKLVPILEKAADSWGKMGDDGKSAIIGLAVAAAALGPTITIVTNLAVAFRGLGIAIAWANGWAQYLWMMRASIISGLVPSLTAATASVWGFTTALLANPITWVIVGIVALGAAAYLIYKNWEPIKKWFSDMWDKIRSAAGKAFAWIGEHLSWTPLGMIVNAWQPIQDFYENLWYKITKVFSDAWEKIKPIVDAVSSFFSSDKSVNVNASSASAFGGGPPLRAVDALPAQAGQGGTARVQVDFANMPKGARVTPAQGNTADLDLSMGYSMVLP